MPYPSCSTSDTAAAVRATPSPNRRRSLPSGRTSSYLPLPVRPVRRARREASSCSLAGAVLVEQVLRVTTTTEPSAPGRGRPGRSERRCHPGCPSELPQKAVGHPVPLAHQSQGADVGLGQTGLAETVDPGQGLCSQQGVLREGHREAAEPSVERGQREVRSAQARACRGSPCPCCPPPPGLYRAGRRPQRNEVAVVRRRHALLPEIAGSDGSEQATGVARSLRSARWRS